MAAVHRRSNVHYIYSAKRSQTSTIESAAHPTAHPAVSSLCFGVNHIAVELIPVFSQLALWPVLVSLPAVVLLVFQPALLAVR